ncbi:excalibur calcium-binding domain-containing protein [Kitasatospora sp. SolWspMP-SS2h]|uniref:excalibur calcium-binding domain-containing protein n=1 Tax=Kitasatospora sp. SolWspMP-SS2h TaxID=1305729 RepID=UPI000DBFA155|nr:excalibur calcium-binding domain-containing protein [Kitasatospora sp. SolWspMP-SS2h]RAJ38673.1 excalibur calcium-binding domain-containing protein [Kitasatospora sp. SolWspMP-SS2h]
MRIALLVFLPPVAAVMVWRSRRVHLAAKALLTVWCLFMTLFWFAVIVGPEKKGNVPAPAATTASPSPDDSPTPEAATSAPEPTPTPASTPTPTPEVPTPEVQVPTPTLPPAVTPEASEPTPGPEHTTEQASAYYKNCTEAKAAGAAPLHRGEPGYRSALDRDGDGIACEK